MLNFGRFSYLNSIFFYHGIDNFFLKKGISFVEGSPAELYEKFLENRVELTQISSGIVPKLKDIYILDGISVSTRKRANSVILFSNIPIENMGEEKIFCTVESKTSVNLLRIICQKKYGFNPDIVKIFDYCEVKNSSPLLLIGDKCIEYLNRNNHKFRYDLGEMWYELTGLPMVFGVFIVKNDYLKENEEYVLEVRKLLKENIEKNIKNIEKLLDINLLKKYEKVFIIRYFKDFQFGFGDKEKESFYLFQKLLNEIDKNLSEIAFKII